MASNNNNAKPKLQGSMEYIIILAIVIIVALTAGVYYLSSVHNAKVGALNNIVSAQASSSNTLLLKLSTTLPAGAQVKNINLTGVPPGTPISVSLENQTPVYNNGYPEYNFSVGGLPEPLPYYNVTSITYEVNGKTITVPTITGEPIAIEEASGYNVGSTLPSGIIAYVPITISNKQNVATPSPFQQMIQINEVNYANYISYNGNIANFEFLTQNSPSGQVLPAWIESNNSDTLTVWVNIPNGIPASSNTIIYLGFASNAINLLSSSGTSGIGEAPQLSCPNPSDTASCSTYAEYDDGASVFNNYWNFAGNTLPTGWTTISTGQPQLLVYHQISSSTPQVLDTLMTSGGRVLLGIATGTSASQGLRYAYILNPSINAYGDDGAPWGLYYDNAILIHSVLGVTMPGVESVGYQNGQAIVNYGTSSYNMSSYSQSYLGQSSYSYIFLSTDTAGCGGGSAVVVNNNLQLQISTNDYCYFDNILQWVRTRSYPPSGVMPSVSFGQIQSSTY